MQRAVVLFLALTFVFSGVARASTRAAVTPQMYSGLHWRLVGPFRGGRSNDAAGVPGNPNVFYFGAVGGGVWKTTNAGLSWFPVMDSQGVASIGALAVAPSDPSIVYAGSGEADMRSDIIHGNGMYKSSDAGAHWTHIGLDDTRQIARIVVDPRDAKRLYVAALGHAYAANSERGVFRSDDGGATWKKVLYKDANTGAIDLAIDPSDARIVYASLWQTRRPPWNIYPPSNGPGSGIYKSVDGGDTWRRLEALSPPGLGHVGLAVSPSQPGRIYAIVDAIKGGLYRSDDGGATWALLDAEQRIWKRCWYFCKVVADPKNADVVYVSNTSFYRSNDGGRSFTPIKGAPGGDDYHRAWIDPTNSDRIVLASDQGTIVSTDGAKSWSSWYNQPTGQFYHVATDNRFPYWLYGAQQDSGAVGTPSRTDHRGISFRDWQPIGAGGESGYIAPDPDNPRLLYGGTVDEYDQLTGQDGDISPERAYPAVYRHTWTLPVAFSPQRPRKLYYSTQVLFRSGDRGKSWQIISPDLTREHPAVPAGLDAPTAHDIHGGARQGVIYTIGLSPRAEQTIWAGTDDGKISITRDGGKTWRDVTPHGLTAWSKIAILEPSHFSADVAYAAVDRHRLDDDRPYIYRTRDGGRSWQLRTAGLPASSFVNVVREDPVRAGLLYAGTETGVFVSFDGAGSWLPLQLNMPTASVRDIALHGDDIAIATHGRAFWILDDVSALRQLAIAPAHEPLELYVPAVALRVRPGNDQGTPLPLGSAQGENPAAGALFDYALSAGAREVRLTISDRTGRTLRRYVSGPASGGRDPRTADIPAAWIHPEERPSTLAGMHRFAWDFREDGGPLAPPGSYRVSVTADGITRSRSFVVRKDPRIGASDADLHAEHDLAQRAFDLQRQAASAYDAALALAKRTAEPARARELADIAGFPPPSNPDDSVGAPETNLRSLHYLSRALSDLASAIESRDAAPSATMRRALDLDARALQATLARWKAFTKT